MRSIVLRRLAPVLVLLAVVGTACGSVERRAATVDGESISASSVQDELQAIGDSGKYQSAVEQQYGAKLPGQSKGTFDSSFTAQVLSLRVYYELIEQSLADVDVKVTAKDEADGLASIREQVDSLGTGVFQKLPKWYRTQLGHDTALINVAQKEATTGALAKRYFAKHKADFEQACVSHILVSTENRSDADAKARAEDLKRQLDAGADFGTLATNDSDDPGSKQTHGDLDCGAKGRFVPAFDKAVFSLPIGKVSDPVKTQFGYHLILVRSRQAGSLQDVPAQQLFQSYLLDIICGKSVDVHIDPRYGTWDRSPCKGGQGLAKVAAPPKPSTK